MMIAPSSKGTGLAAIVLPRPADGEPHLDETERCGRRHALDGRVWSEPRAALVLRGGRKPRRRALHGSCRPQMAAGGAPEADEAIHRMPIGYGRGLVSGPATTEARIAV